MPTRDLIEEGRHTVTWPVVEGVTRRVAGKPTGGKPRRGGGSVPEALAIYNALRFWHGFDEASGLPQDLHTNALHATSQSGTTQNQSPLVVSGGKSITLPGGTSYVEVAETALLATGSNDFSIGMIAKRTGAQANFPKYMWKQGNTPASGQANYLFSLDQFNLGGKMVFRVTHGANNQDAADTINMADGQSYHFVGVCNFNTSVKLYRDGGLITTTNIGTFGNISGNTTGLRYGYFGSAGDVVNGAIDEAWMTMRALSPAEVSYLWNGGNPKRYAQLKVDAGF
jgi:hypothetical protein